MTLKDMSKVSSNVSRVVKKPFDIQFPSSASVLFFKFRNCSWHHLKRILGSIIVPSFFVRYRSQLTLPSPPTMYFKVWTFKLSITILHLFSTMVCVVLLKTLFYFYFESVLSLLDFVLL